MVALKHISRYFGSYTSEEVALAREKLKSVDASKQLELRYSSEDICKAAQGVIKYNYDFFAKGIDEPAEFMSFFTKDMTTEFMSFFKENYNFVTQTFTVKVPDEFFSFFTKVSKISAIIEVSKALSDALSPDGYDNWDLKCLLNTLWNNKKFDDALALSNNLSAVVLIIKDRPAITFWNNRFKEQKTI